MVNMPCSPSSESLEGRQDTLQMYPLVLEIPSRCPYLLELVTPKHLELRAQRDNGTEGGRPAHPQSDAGQRRWIRRGAVVVPAVADIHKRHHLDIIGPASVAQERDAGFQRGDQGVVPHQLVLPIATYAEAPTEADLFERQERVGRQLEIQACKEFEVMRREAAGPLHLAQPGEKAPVGE